MPVQPKVCDLATALGRLRGNCKLLQEMLDLFREDAPHFQQELRSAVDRGDGTSALQATHGLRGMLAYFSAEVALQVAERVEQLAVESDFAGARNAALELDVAIERFIAALATEIADLPVD
jgi:HPt (histidine-containing phosphotransfer) domain-containing protein